MPERTENPCQRCGACCAGLRVDFDIAERDDTPGGFVPTQLADQLNARLCRMRGTDSLPPRCVALVGRPGEAVRCGIYEHRPSPCREFEAGSEACNRLRRGLALSALSQ